MQAGVFLHNAPQRHGHLVQVGFGGRGNGHPVIADGHGDGVEAHLVIAGAQGVAGDGGGELADGANVAGGHFGQVFLVLAAGQIELADAFRLPLGAVPHFGVAAEGSLIDAEHRELADEGVGGGLEHQGGQGRRRVDGVVGGAAVGFPQRGAAPVGRRGQIGLHRFQKVADGDVLRGRGSQHRHQLALQHGGAQAGGDFLGGQLFAAEVAVGQGVVAFGGGFDETLAGGFGFVRQLVGDGGVRVGHIDHAAKAVGGADGNLKGNALAAKGGLHIGQRLLEVGVLPVHLVDDDDAGEAGGFAGVPGAFGADVHAAGGGHQDDGALGHPNGAGHFAAEVVIAGGVEEVHLVAVAGGGDQGGLNTAAPLDFFRFVVGNGIAVFDAALAGYGFGVEQHRFAERRFAGAGVGQEYHVPDVSRIHTGLAPSRLNVCGGAPPGIARRKGGRPAQGE